MKKLKFLTATFLCAAVWASPLMVWAAEKKADKPKPYTLSTCVVSDEKFGGEMGEPYVFTHEGQEIKLCCKSCLKSFKKEPAKYLKKIAEGEKKAPKKSSQP